MHKKDFYLLYKRENELFEMYHYTRVIITAILMLHVLRLFYKIFRIRWWYYELRADYLDGEWTTLATEQSQVNDFN